MEKCSSADGVSPAQMFLGRCQRSLLPTLPGNQFMPDFPAMQNFQHERTEKMKGDHDLHSSDLTSLRVGETVLLQHPISSDGPSVAQFMKCVSMAAHTGSIQRVEKGREEIDTFSDPSIKNYLGH